MRLGPKIFLVSALAIVALSTSIGWSLLTVKRLVSVNREIATRSVPALRLQGELRETLHALVRLETRVLVLGDREYARAWSDRNSPGVMAGASCRMTTFAPLATLRAGWRPAL